MTQDRDRDIAEEIARYNIDWKERRDKIEQALKQVRQEGRESFKDEFFCPKCRTMYLLPRYGGNFSSAISKCCGVMMLTPELKARKETAEIEYKRGYEDGLRQRKA